MRIDECGIKMKRGKKMEGKEKRLSEEQLDFLGEMMNVGAGNAVTALTKMLQCKVDMRIPRVHALAVPQVPSVLSDPSRSVACVRMGMVGEVTGGIFFVVPDDQKIALMRLAERASGMRNSDFGVRNSKSAIRNPQSAISNPHSEDLSVLAEMGNILAGAYLTAIHDFCKRNIYHTVPRVAIDMIQSLLDESLATTSREVKEIIIVVNDFITAEEDITTFFLIIPSPQSVKTLVDSIDEARRGMMMGRQGERAKRRKGETEIGGDKEWEKE